MGQIITFYSYKGGVGRTMTLANIAVLLASWGKRVLVVDWDLEAPGLEQYFNPFVDPKEIATRDGVLDYLTNYSFLDAQPFAEQWAPDQIPIPLADLDGALYLIGAGKRDDDYFQRLRSFDIESLYSDQQGGVKLETLRDFWKSHYDYVLLDSRTGITDIGGICTIHLPDILVLMFTATAQSLGGAIDVARRANNGRQKLPFDRLGLSCLPLPSRFDTITEHLVAQEWLDTFERSLGPLYSEWLPTEIDRRKFLELTKIPYISYFSFGERLAVLEQPPSDPAGLSYAYESVAALLANGLANADQLLVSRDSFLRLAMLHKPLPTRQVEIGETTVLLIDPDRSAVVSESVSLSQRNRWLLDLRERLLMMASEHGGEIISSTDDSYLFRFTNTHLALTCGIHIQRQMAVNPLRSGTGPPAKARMSAHGIAAMESSSPRVLRDLITATASIVRNAKVGQLIVSDFVRRRTNGPSDEIQFKAAGEVEVGELPDEQISIETYEVIAITAVYLHPEEIALLYEQDPSTRSAGGFQAFLVLLQLKANRKTGRLELTVSDLERIARYAFDYRQGGWQNKLHRIFGRVLGLNLGRAG